MEIPITQIPEDLKSANVQGDELYHFTLRTQDTFLELYILDMEPPIAWTSISRRGRPHIPGSTTALYSQAGHLIQQAANSLSREIAYTLRTKHPKMVAWAKSSGQAVFNWDNTTTHDGTLFAKRTFTPNL